MRRITDEALVIPVYDEVAAAIQQPWVHSTLFEQGHIRWQTEENWIENP